MPWRSGKWGRVMTYEALFVNAGGRTSRGQFTSALLPLLVAAALFYFLVPGTTGHWCLLVLLFPATILHARRLHDMGWTAWLLLAPALPVAAAIWLHMVRPGSGITPAMALIALAALAGCALWGLFGKGETSANAYGEPLG